MSASPPSLNIDDFCRDVAITLVKLARAFPQPQNLFVEDIYQPEETDEFGLHSPRYLACYAALLWLSEEGYLRYVEVVRNEAIEQAVLSARCITRLIVPLSTELDSSDTLALEHNTRLHHLDQALKAGTSTPLRAAVIELLQDFSQ